MVWENMPEDHNIQAIDESFDYVLLNYFTKQLMNLLTMCY